MASENPGQEASLPGNPKAQDPEAATMAAAAAGLKTPHAQTVHVRVSPERRVFAVLILALGIVVALGALEYRWVRQTNTDNLWVFHTQDVQREIGATQKSLNDSDACTLTFLLSDQTEPAPACEQMIAGIGLHLSNLRALTLDNPMQQQRLAAMEGDARAIMSGLHAAIQLPRAGAAAAEPAAALEGSLRQSVLELRSMLGVMEFTEFDLLNQRKSAAQQSFNASGFLIFVGTATAFVLLLASGAGLQLGITQRRQAEAALREQEQRFALMVDGVQDYAIFMMDPDGRIISWNKGAQRIKGYAASEIVGRNFSLFYPEFDNAAGLPAIELATAAREGQLQTEGWRLRKDGTRFWASMLITARRNEAGELVGFSKVTRDVTEKMEAQAALEKEVRDRRAAQEKLHASERSLRELSLHLLRTQDEERRSIGRDMHDSLGQYLSVIKMRLDSVVQSQKETLQSSEIARCVELTDQCIREVRTISYLLYPPMLEEMGLSSAIPWCLEGFSKRSGISTRFEMPDHFERLSRDAELTLFRVLQESLTNVHRHSGSPAADVLLTRSDKEVVLEVRDQGNGATRKVLEGPSQDWSGTHGVGLRGMDERLRQLGGSLEVAFSETGTIVRATIPL